VVTADHGRATDFASHDAPESERVWLLAAGGAVPARGLVAAAEPRRLADVAPTLRALLAVPDARADDAGSAIPELLPTLLTDRSGARIGGS
jgi:hypothetical protein